MEEVKKDRSNKSKFSPVGYTDRKEYLRLYQLNKYKNDEAFRQRQIDKVRTRYYEKKNRVKESSTLILSNEQVTKTLPICAV